MDTIHHTAESDHLGNRMEDFVPANQSLRGSDLKNDNNDPVGVITQLKSFMRSFSTNPGTVQGSYNNGDIKGAGKSLRYVVGSLTAGPLASTSLSPGTSPITIGSTVSDGIHLSQFLVAQFSDICCCCIVFAISRRR